MERAPGGEVAGGPVIPPRKLQPFRRVVADVVDVGRIEMLGDDDMGKPFCRNRLADVAGARHGAEDHSAHALAHEELCVGLALALVALEIEDGDVEALLADAAEDAGHQHRVILVEAGVAGVDQPDVGGDALADGAEVSDLVGDAEDPFARAGTDFRVVIEGARDGGDVNAKLIGDLNHRQWLEELGAFVEEIALCIDYRANHALDSPNPPSGFWTERSQSTPLRTASLSRPGRGWREGSTLVRARKTPLVP